MTVRVLFAVAVVAGCSARVLACDCRRLPELSPAVRGEAAVIFLGRVLETRDRSEHVTIERQNGSEGSVRQIDRVAVFNVERAWSGVSSEQTSITTDWSDCQFVFSPGQSYLVFADPGTDGRPYTSSCFRTRALSEAAEVLSVLGEPSWVPPALKGRRSSRAGRHRSQTAPPRRASRPT